jgi:hypothetical protein
LAEVPYSIENLVLIGSLGSLGSLGLFNLSVQRTVFTSFSHYVAGGFQFPSLETGQSSRKNQFLLTIATLPSANKSINVQFFVPSRLKNFMQTSEETLPFCNSLSVDRYFAQYVSVNG